MAVAGELIEVVVFKSPTVTVNNEGGRAKSFASTITTKAKVRSGRQARTEPDALSVSKEFTIRYRQDADLITKDWLIAYDGEDYTINSIDLDIKKQFLTFSGATKTHG